MVSFLATRAVTPTALTPGSLTQLPITTGTTAPFTTEGDRFSDGANSVEGAFANVRGGIVRRSPALFAGASALACGRETLSNNPALFGGLASLAALAILVFHPYLIRLTRGTSRLIARANTEVNASDSLKNKAESKWRAYAFGPKQVDDLINAAYKKGRLGSKADANLIVDVVNSLADTRSKIFTRQHVTGMIMALEDVPELGFSTALAKLAGGKRSRALFLPEYELRLKTLPPEAHAEKVLTVLGKTIA